MLNWYGGIILFCSKEAPNGFLRTEGTLEKAEELVKDLANDEWIEYKPHMLCLYPKDYNEAKGE